MTKQRYELNPQPGGGWVVKVFPAWAPEDMPKSVLIVQEDTAQRSAHTSLEQALERVRLMETVSFVIKGPAPTEKFDPKPGEYYWSWPSTGGGSTS